ncbi:MAG: hypothetical protein HC808_00405 [Candidatus Competibacteraceae bacterium]|nr:hypothetical protein [Candidatus Competibacteraceae bacterium]
MTPALTVVMVATAIGALLLSPSLLKENQSVGQPERRGDGSRSFAVIMEAVVFEPERTRIEAVGTSRAIRSGTL